MRPARLGQAMASARTGRGFYPRYPRYPQVESAFAGAGIMTASRRGRDDPSETTESLPSHSRSGCPAGRLRAAGQVRSKGRAADEAAARRTMTGLPFSECESGRLREAPIFGTERLRAGGTGAGGTANLRVQRPAQAESGISVSASPPVEKGFGPDRSGRTGFRPGGCEPADPALRRMDRQAEPRASARGSSRLRGLRLRPQEPRRQE